MQTSRFQLGLIATLAVGLGFSLASSQAVGYPAGAAISLGANPIISSGGFVAHGSENALFDVPADRDLIVTDVVLTSHSNMECKRSHRTKLSLASGTTIAEFETASATARRYYDYDSSTGLSVQHTFGSGLRIPAGELLSLGVSESSVSGSCSSSSSYGVAYAVAGYYAQP